MQILAFKSRLNIQKPKMDIQTLYKMKSKFVARKVGNELIIVPLTDNVAQMSELFTLNETAKFLWENISEHASNEDIEKLLTDEFEVDAETTRRDVAAFLSNMDILLKK